MNINAMHLVLGLLGAVTAICLAPLVGICAGAFIGWIVGLFFPGTVGLVGSAIAGGAVLPAWQVGAALGFAGGFFRPRVINNG